MDAELEAKPQDLAATAIDLEEDANDFAEVCHAFQEQYHPGEPAFLKNVQEWLRREERDFFFSEINRRHIFFCTRYDHEGDGLDAWVARIEKRVELPAAAIPLAAAKLGDGPVEIGPLKLPPSKLGPSACPQCGIRKGLGTCAECLRLEAVEGVDGQRHWIRAVLDLLENRRHLDPDDRETLLNWLAGLD